MVQADSDNNNKPSSSSSNGTSSPASINTSPTSGGNSNSTMMTSNYSSNSTTPSSTTTPPHHAANQPDDLPNFIEKYPGRACCFCNLCERTALGQGEMLRLMINMAEFRTAFKQSLEENNKNTAGSNENQESRESFHHNESNSSVNERKRNSPGGSPRQRTVINNELINELDFIGHEELPTSLEMIIAKILSSSTTATETPTTITSTTTSVRKTPTTPTVKKKNRRKSPLSVKCSPPSNRKSNELNRDNCNNTDKINDESDLQLMKDISKLSEEQERNKDNVGIEMIISSTATGKDQTKGTVIESRGEVKDQNNTSTEESDAIEEKKDEEAMEEEKNSPAEDGDVHDDDDGNLLDDNQENSYIYIHTMCAMWSLQLRRIDEQHFPDQQLTNNIKLETTLAQCLFNKCSFCQRYGASVNCRMSCTKRYHLPCAAAASCFQIIESFSTFCLDHLHQVPYIGKW